MRTVRQEMDRYRKMDKGDLEYGLWLNPFQAVEWCRRGMYVSGAVAVMASCVVSVMLAPFYALGGLLWLVGKAVGKLAGNAKEP